MAKIILHMGTGEIELAATRRLDTVSELRVNISDADLLRAVMAHYPALSDMAKRAKAYLEFDNVQLEYEYEQAVKSLTHQQELVAKIERKRENKSELRQLFDLIGELE